MFRLTITTGHALPGCGYSPAPSAAPHPPTRRWCGSWCGQAPRDVLSEDVDELHSKLDRRAGNLLGAAGSGTDVGTEGALRLIFALSAGTTARDGTRVVTWCRFPLLSRRLQSHCEKLAADNALIKEQNDRLRENVRRGAGAWHQLLCISCCLCCGEAAVLQTTSRVVHGLSACVCSLFLARRCASCTATTWAGAAGAHRRRPTPAAPSSNRPRSTAKTTSASPGAAAPSAKGTWLATRWLGSSAGRSRGDSPRSSRRRAQAGRH